MDKNALYYTAPYQKEFDAEVLSCTEKAGQYLIVLDRNGFYPEGGGQPADTGSIGRARVLDVREDTASGLILHRTDLPLAPGEKVHCTIDWQKRFRNMQNHSGEHIISGLIHRHYGFDNVGFHMGDVITIDFNGAIGRELLMRIEAEANAVVCEDREIRILYPSAEELPQWDYRSKKELNGTVRLVEIEGTDLCACCGTHVRRTGEIGVIKLLSAVSHRGGTRIEMTAGLDAAADYDRKHRMLLEAARMLSVKPEELTDALRQYKAESAAKDLRIAALNERYFRSVLKELPDSEETVSVFEEGLNPIELRKLCDLLVKNGKGRVVAAFAPKTQPAEVQPGSDAGAAFEYMYVIGSRSLDVREGGKRLNALLSGRGGGSAEMLQGSVRASEGKIREILPQIF